MLDAKCGRPSARGGFSGRPTSVADVIRLLWLNPGDLLIRHWNWKSAIFSSVIRAAIFFFANLTAGWRAATGAMLAEFVYRALTAGFYGALTQAFRKAEPAWAAGGAVMVLLPLVSHSIELGIHFFRGTPNLTASLCASIGFTAISTLFNLYAMRRGILVVGSGCGSVWSDLKRVPGVMLEFILVLPAAIVTRIRLKGEKYVTSS